MNSFHNEPILYIDSISTGFIEIPNQISINIYASGCKKCCPGCQNQNLQQFKRKLSLTDEIFYNALSHYFMANWICFLGGDAVYQPKGLERVAHLAKKERKFVCLYTGLNFYELSEININNIDLIVDGPYDKQRGTVDSPTTNQHCYVNETGIWRAVLFKDLKDYKWDTAQHKDLTRGLYES